MTRRAENRVLLPMTASPMVPVNEIRDPIVVKQEQTPHPGPIVRVRLSTANQDLRAASRSELLVCLLEDIAGFHGRSRGSAGFRWTTPSSAGPPKNYLNPGPLPRILPFFFFSPSSFIHTNLHQQTPSQLHRGGPSPLGVRPQRLLSRTAALSRTTTPAHQPHASELWAVQRLPLPPKAPVSRSAMPRARPT